MAHGNRPAIDVDPGRVHLERLQKAQDDGGESLVHLEQVNIANPKARTGQNPLGHRYRPGQHDGRIGADFGGGADPGARFQPMHHPKLRIADQNRRRPIGDPAGVSGVVHMFDPLQMRVFHQGHLVEAGHRLAHLGKRRFQGTKGLHIGAGPHVFIAVEDQKAVAVAYGNHAAGKAPLRPSRRRPLLTFHRQSIELIAAETIFGGEDIR